MYLAPGWSRDSAGGYSSTGTMHRLPEILPAPHTAAWEHLLHDMRRFFLSDTRHVRPPVRAGQLFFCHPAQEAMIESLREIYNGEIEPPCDGEGNQGELPRVWRWEHHLKIFWVIELPAQWSRRQFELQFAA
ncbi:MAG TPA: hypothetical protein VK985_09500 [Rariglobus sp.]|nr:hypothetical protein [Rariglobus sp.]